jgi:hypothetical protein
MSVTAHVSPLMFGRFDIEIPSRLLLAELE